MPEQAALDFLRRAVRTPSVTGAELAFAQLIVEGESTFDLTPYRLERFADGVEAEAIEPAQGSRGESEARYVGRVNLACGVPKL